MKILFALSSPEYLRFFDTALTTLADRGHELHAVFDEAAEYKPVGLSGAAALPLASVTVVPRARTFWADTAIAYRAVVDFLRFLHPDYAHAAILRERVRRKVLPAACQWLRHLRRLPAGVLQPLLRVLQLGERALPADARVRQTLASIGPDLIVVSPLVEAASPQVDWVKAGQRQGRPAAVAVASWDNLTNKGLMRVRPDRVLVWNDIQRDEAIRYHAVPADRIVTTGAAVFDRWFDRQPSRSRQAFCRAAGLTDDRPFVLFTCSSPFIAGDTEEVAFVRRWIDTLRAAAEPAVRDAGVLIRPHPYNTHPWDEAALPDDAAVVWPRGAFNPAAEDGRQDFFDSLYHAAAVVGLNTSAMIEAAIVGRPVLTVTELETQQGTLHFRYLLHENGGPVRQAASLGAHVAQLADALRETHRERAPHPFVRTFVRPQGLDEPSAPRLADAIEDVALLTPDRDVSVASRLVLRAALAIFGGWVALVARLTSRKALAPVRKHLLDPVRVVRRRAVHAAARGRERTVRQVRLTGRRLRRADHALRVAARALPSAWRRCRRAVRQARYAVGMLRRGHSPAPPGKPS